MIKLTPILIFLLFSAGCEKYQYIRQTGYGLEFYYISDFQKINGTSKIINSTVKLSDSVIIHYDEIISYEPDSYTFTVSEYIADKLDDFRSNPIHGKAFAVTINKQLIYTGYFWASYSSSMVDWITIDPLNYGGRNKLQVQLGYPGLILGDYIPDNRNDRRILDFLEKDGKLE